MKKLIIFGVVAVAAYYLLLSGGSGSGSGTANFTIDGTQYDLDDMEFRVEVNPRIGETNPDTVIAEGSPQAIRCIIRNASWPNPKGGEGFSISWWMHGDNPMAALESTVGETREHDPRDVKVLNMRLKADGKSVHGGDQYSTWLKIDSITDGIANGFFGGKLEEEPLSLASGSEPEVVEVEDGSFTVPISKLYRQK